MVAAFSSALRNFSHAFLYDEKCLLLVLQQNVYLSDLIVNQFVFCVAYHIMYVSGVG